MKGRSASKIKLTSYDELLGGGEETNDIQQVSLEHLHSFENHPFQVNDDEASEACCRPCSVGTLDEQRRRKIMEYHGLVSYNTDIYQEDHVSWWDCVDVISSSGYYPIDQWEQELDRIEKIVLKYRKLFFFAEAGCMSRKGSGMVPNNWELQGELRLEEKCVLMELISVMTDCFFYAIINS